MGNRLIDLGLYRVLGKLIHLSIKLISVSDSARQRQRDRFRKDAKVNCNARMTTPRLWGEIERTTSDLIAYPGLQEWWKTRRHWHTEEFGRVVDAIIARGTEPKAYSTYNLR
jgi:hypothetical protein